MKLIKRISLTLGVLVTSLALLTSCGEPPENAEAEAVVATALDLYKNGDYAAFLGMTVDGYDFLASDGEKSPQVKAAFANIDYEIIDSKITGDTAVVNVNITSIDMSQIMDTYLNAYASFGFSEDSSEEEMTAAANQLLNELVSDPNAPTISATTPLNLAKIDGQWKLVVDNNLIGPLTGYTIYK